MPYVGRVPSAVPVTADDIPANSIDASKIVDGAIAVADVADNAITEAKIADAAVVSLKSGRKNLIINGGMNVAQRATSSAANGYVSLDRWYSNLSGGTATFSQETFAAGSDIAGNKHYAKLNTTIGNNYTAIRTRIEDVRTVAAGTITISFWAKGVTPDGGLGVWIGQDFGTSGSADVDYTAQTVNLTASWQLFSFQFTVASMSGKTINSGSFFSVAIGQYSSSSTAAWELDITNVQLELGSVATDFEHRSYGEELALCQRYYQLNASSTGQTYSSTVGTFAINLFTPMRDIPTAVVVATSNKIMHIGTAYRNAVNVQAMELNTLYGGTINITMSSTASDARHILTGGTVGFDAEL